MASGGSNIGLLGAAGAEHGVQSACFAWPLTPPFPLSRTVQAKERNLEAEVGAALLACHSLTQFVIRQCAAILCALFLAVPLVPCVSAAYSSGMLSVQADLARLVTERWFKVFLIFLTLLITEIVYALKQRNDLDELASYQHHLSCLRGS